jgi:hypothetical protein
VLKDLGLHDGAEALLPVRPADILAGRLRSCAGSAVASRWWILLRPSGSERQMVIGAVKNGRYGIQKARYQSSWCGPIILSMMNICR